jgi:hypothetical protein
MESSVDLPTTVPLYADFDGAGVGEGVEDVSAVSGCVDSEGVGVAIDTPLSQINFLPDLIHVYLFPRQTICCPMRVHFKLGPVTAKALPENCSKATALTILRIRRRCIEILSKVM